MKILITGAGGFLGINLVGALEKQQKHEIMSFNSKDNPDLLDHYAWRCDFLYHLAAVHRPKDETAFEKVNHLFFANLLERLKAAKNHCPVLLPSSVHGGKDSGYGRSKLAAEEALIRHSRQTGSRAVIYRLTNTFGPHARPHAHSVVATFCYNLARGLPIEIHDPDRVMRFYYISDVVDSFIVQLELGKEQDDCIYYRLPREKEYEITLQVLADRLNHFKRSLERDEEPGLGDLFSRRLYQTYLHYLP